MKKLLLAALVVAILIPVAACTSNPSPAIAPVSPVIAQYTLEVKQDVADQAEAFRISATADYSGMGYPEATLPSECPFDGTSLQPSLDGKGYCVPDSDVK